MYLLQHNVLFFGDAACWRLLRAQGSARWALWYVRRQGDGRDAVACWTPPHWQATCHLSTPPPLGGLSVFLGTSQLTTNGPLLDTDWDLLFFVICRWPICRIFVPGTHVKVLKPKTIQQGGQRGRKEIYICFATFAFFCAECL